MRPPSRQGNTLRAPPPPLLKSGNFMRPPFNMAKTSSYCIKTTPKRTFVKVCYTYLVTIARCGGFIHAPMKRTRFSWRVLRNMATSSLKTCSWSWLSVSGSMFSILMATSPCQFPLKETTRIVRVKGNQKAAKWSNESEYLKLTKH